MKSVSIAVVVAAIAVSAPGQAQTPAKPWTEADYAERAAMAGRWLDPMEQALHTSVALDLDDPAGACESAKTAVSYLEIGRKDMASLDARLRAEGKDMAPMTDGHAMMAELETIVTQRAGNACASRSASATPEQRADDDRIIRYGQAYAAARKAVADALANNDRATACAKTAEIVTVAAELNGFVGALKTKYAGDAKMTAELTKIAATTDGWGADARTKVPDCPAA